MNTKDLLPKIIIIEGTNASGKSALGIELAQKYNGEIISADSRQIFRGFDLCCGKVTQKEMGIVPHHLIDICNIGDNFSVSDYQKKVYELIPEIIDRGKMPFIVGGTGLYISSIVYGYDFPDECIDEPYRKMLEAKTLNELQNMIPKEFCSTMNSSDFSNKRRLVRLLERIHYGEGYTPNNAPRYKALQIGITWPKEILHRRIEERLSRRIEQGMLDEVKKYLDAGGNPKYLYDLGLEYKYITRYLQGEYKSLDVFYQEMSRAIKKFAKRQLTWFNRDKTIHWVDMTSNYFDQACNLIDDFLYV